MKHATYIIFIILIPIFSFGQDSLLFSKKRDYEEKYFIELNTYKVKVKPIKGKKFWAYIVDYCDSTLILKGRVYNKKTREEMRNLSFRSFESIQKNNLTSSQQDSAFLELTRQLKDIEYSEDIELNVSLIKKITINNYYRPDKKKMMQTVDALGYSALGGMLLVGPTLMLINPIFTPVFAFFYFYSTVYIPVAIIAETKQLNLQRTWNIEKKNCH